MFHIHTIYTDGKLKVEDYFEFSKTHNLDKLIFLEHIRRESDYDVSKFIGEIKNCVESYKIQALAGFETKILTDGTLDISDNDLARADLLGIAEHGFPGDYSAYRNAFSKVIDRYSPLTRIKPVVWVHPGLWFIKNRLMSVKSHEYLEMIDIAQKNGLFIEQNFRYKLIADDFKSSVPLSKLVLGVDAHTHEHLDAWLKRSK